MTPTDYAMLALGTLSLAVFAFAGGVAVMVLIDELIPNIERITDVLFPVTDRASAVQIDTSDGDMVSPRQCAPNAIRRHATEKGDVVVDPRSELICGYPFHPEEVLRSLSRDVDVDHSAAKIHRERLELRCIRHG